MAYGKSQTELKHPFRWYQEQYGLCLSTVRRHRALLDHPSHLLMSLYNMLGGVKANPTKLVEYLRKHPTARK